MISICFSLFFNKNPPRRPKTPQDVPRCLQDASKTPPRRPKTPPRCPKMPPRRLQDAPRCLQDAPRCLQDAPKMPRHALRYPKMPQVPQHTSTSHMHPGAGHGGRCGRRRLDPPPPVFSRGAERVELQNRYITDTEGSPHTPHYPPPHRFQPIDLSPPFFIFGQDPSKTFQDASRCLQDVSKMPPFFHQKFNHLSISIFY